MRYLTNDVDRPAAVIAAVALTAICLLPVMLTPYIVGAAGQDRELALQPSQLGLLAASLVGGAITVMATSVFWVRRCNWRVLVAAGSAMACAANLYASYAHTFAPLIVAVLVASCATGAAYAPAICALSDTRDPDRNFAYSFFLQIVVSGIAGFLISGLVPRLGIVSPLRLIAVFFAAGLLLAPMLPVRGVKAGAKSVQAGGIPGLQIWAGLVGMLLMNAGPMAVWAFYERIGAAAGFNEHAIGNVIALSLLMGAPGALLSSVAARRFGRRLPLTVATIPVLAAFAASVATRDLRVYLISALLIQFLVNFGLAFQYGAMSAADISGRLIVLGPTFQGMGGVIGPVIAGALVRDGNYAPVAALGASLTLAGLLLILWLCLGVAGMARPRLDIPPNR
jgi:hypothetical protein